MRSQLGGYLAVFMWRRRCDVDKRDHFDAILEDMGKHYDASAWRTLTEADELLATERLTKAKLKQGRQKVLGRYKVFITMNI